MVEGENAGSVPLLSAGFAIAAAVLLGLNLRASAGRTFDTSG